MRSAIRILAVDNEPSVTLSLRYVFAGPQYEITCVGDGNAALSRLDVSADRYDVIIVDQKMPNLTGVELVTEIRKRHVEAEILVVSAHLSGEVRAAYTQLNVRAMLPKPFNIDELRSTVDSLAFT
jgi:DNA-binding response OmpR family regulator